MSGGGEVEEGGREEGRIENEEESGVKGITGGMKKELRP